MNKDKASLISEATLWQLYRGLLAADLLQRYTAGWRPPMARSSSRSSASIGAALAANLLPGDTLGLDPGDLTTRALLGVPLRALRSAVADERGSRRRRPTGAAWALETDAKYRLLPGTGVQQASLAAGAAVASRLHGLGSMTVLFSRPGTGLAASKCEQARTSKKACVSSRVPDWAGAAETAVALHLPLLFLAESATGSPQPQPDSKQPAPTLPAIPVDRSDAIALYRVIYEAAGRARTGGGPTWVDCRDALPGTNKAENPAQLTARALKNMEEALHARGLLNRQRQKQLQRGLEKEFTQGGWLAAGPI